MNADYFLPLRLEDTKNLDSEWTRQKRNEPRLDIGKLSAYVVVCPGNSRPGNSGNSPGNSRKLPPETPQHSRTGLPLTARHSFYNLNKRSGVSSGNVNLDLKGHGNPIIKYCVPNGTNLSVSPISQITYVALRPSSLPRGFLWIILSIL